MYRIIGREKIGGREARYIVEFSREWPSDVERIYLIGDFTSLYPGFKWLIREGGRGYTWLKLFPGTYGYGFLTNKGFSEPFDPENSEKICFYINFHPDQETCLSKAVIPGSNDPLKEIYHIEKEPMFLHKYLDKIIIRFMAHPSIENVLLETSEHLVKPSNKYVEKNYIVYEYHVDAVEILRYRFMLNYRGRVLRYGYNGLGEDPEPITIYYDEIPGYSNPPWFIGTIYYQIFIDSFENGDPSNDPPEKIVDREPRRWGYYGGDLKGVVKRLDYLRELGVETIYLTPIYPSTSYHRYDVYDYTSIDKYLGDLKVLKELVEQVHRNNMKLVLDITMHHASPCIEMFRDVLRNWKRSRYYDWFLYRGEPEEWVRKKLLEYVEPECRFREIFSREKWIHGRKPFYEGFFDSWTMVKFNHLNPDVLEFFQRITRTWFERGVDGFRIDVAMGIKSSWLYQYYVWVKQYIGDFLVLGEVSEEPSIYTGYFDSIMNYYLRRILFETLVYRRIGFKEMLYMLNKLYSRIPIYYALSLYNLLGSHDTPRIKTIARDKKVLKLLYTLLFILPGSPAMYYGDETGLEGGRDPDNRRPMNWDRSKWDQEIFNHIKRLVEIYKSSKCIRRGFYSFSLVDNVFIIKRWLDDEEVYGLFNLSGEKSLARNTVSPGRYRELYSGEDLVVGDEIVLEPYQYFLLKPI